MVTDWHTPFCFLLENIWFISWLNYMMWQVPSVWNLLGSRQVFSFCLVQLAAWQKLRSVRLCSCPLFHCCWLKQKQALEQKPSGRRTLALNGLAGQQVLNKTLDAEIVPVVCLVVFCWLHFCCHRKEASWVVFPNALACKAIQYSLQPRFWRRVDSKPREVDNPSHTFEPFMFEILENTSQVLQLGNWLAYPDMCFVVVSAGFSLIHFSG